MAEIIERLGVAKKPLMVWPVVVLFVASAMSIFIHDLELLSPREPGIWSVREPPSFVTIFSLHQTASCTIAGNASTAVRPEDLWTESVWNHNRNRDWGMATLLAVGITHVSARVTHTAAQIAEVIYQWIPWTKL